MQYCWRFVDTGKEYEQAVDRKYWGPVALQYEQLFSSGAWLTTKGIIAFHRKAPIEARSPCVQAVLRRHLPKIASALRAAPSNRILWYWYAWASMVARDRDAYKLGLDLYIQPEHPDSQLFKDFLASGAEGRGDWQEVLRLHKSTFRDLWKRPFPKTRSMDFLNQAAVSEWAFELLFRPVMTALVRTDDREGARHLLRGLKLRGEEYAVVLRRCAGLLKAEGKSDWMEGLPVDPAELNDMLPEIQPQPVFVCQGFTVPTGKGKLADRYHVAVRNLDSLSGLCWDVGLNVDFITYQEWVAESYRRHLGWEPGVPRWALLSAEQRVLATGSSQLDETAVIECLQARGVKTHVQALDDLIQRYPENVELQYERLGRLMGAGGQHLATKEKGSSSRVDPRLEVLADGFEALLKRDWWFLAPLQEQMDFLGDWELPHLVDVWPKGVPVKAMASHHLQRVEDIVRCHPKQVPLWDLFLGFHQASGAPVLSDSIRRIGMDDLGAVAEKLSDRSVRHAVVTLARERAWELVERLLATTVKRCEARHWFGSNIEIGSISYLLEAQLQTGKSADVWVFVKRLLTESPQFLAEVKKFSKEALCQRLAKLLAEVVIPEPEPELSEA